jgi:hypothetical protein
MMTLYKVFQILLYHICFFHGALYEKYGFRIALSSRVSPNPRVVRARAHHDIFIKISLTPCRRSSPGDTMEVLRELEE